MLTQCQNVSLQMTLAWAIAKGTLPVIGVTKKKHAENAVKAAHISLTADKDAQPEATADAQHINAIRFWKKEMK